jgi:hypothetical protein
MSVAARVGGPDKAPPSQRHAASLLQGEIIRRALRDSFAKLDPHVQVRNAEAFAEGRGRAQADALRSTLAKHYGIREHDMAELHAEFVPFTAQTRMSGVDLDGRQLRKAPAARSSPSSRPRADGRRASCATPWTESGGRAAPPWRSRARQPGAGRDLPQGHDQGRDGPAL